MAVVALHGQYFNISSNLTEAKSTSIPQIISVILSKGIQSSWGVIHEMRWLRILYVIFNPDIDWLDIHEFSRVTRRIDCWLSVWCRWHGNRVIMGMGDLILVALNLIRLRYLIYLLLLFVIYFILFKAMKISRLQLKDLFALLPIYFFGVYYYLFSFCFLKIWFHLWLSGYMMLVFYQEVFVKITLCIPLFRF